jgi:hypothetical protein
MDLAELRERLEKASGPDRALDGLIAVLGGWEWHGDGDAERHSEFAGHWVKPGYPTNGSFGKRGPGLCDCNDIDDVFGNDEDCPRFTASLDAIVSLIERKLPGNHWRVERSCEYPGLAFRAYQFTAWCGDYGTPKFAEAPTPALALCLAFVKAMEAQSNEPASERVTGGSDRE